jgi:hypothetical protein
MGAAGAPQEQQAAGPTMSRRTILRGAAHAAWAAPVISVVAAAPAFAVSASGTLSLSTPPTGTWSGNALQVALVVSATGGGGPVQVTLSLPNEYFRGNSQVSVVAPAGWGVSVSYQGRGNSRTGLVVLTRSSSLAPGAPAALTFTVTPSKPVGQPTVPLSVQATGAGLTGTSTVFTPT